MSKDFWIAQYEAIPDLFGQLVEKYGDDFARDVIKRELKDLGLDAEEIDNHISSMISEMA